jgi:cytochrome P450
MFERWVLEDFSYGGVDFAKGTELALLFGSANRDPSVFADPDRLDISRADNSHISFGAGIHFCLGAPLARVEMEVSFGTLLRRAPKLALRAEPEWKAGYILRGLNELLVDI